MRAAVVSRVEPEVGAKLLEKSRAELRDGQAGSPGLF